MRKRNLIKTFFSTTLALLLMLSLNSVNAKAAIITEPEVNMSATAENDLVPVGTMLVNDFNGKMNVFFNYDGGSFRPDEGEIQTGEKFTLNAKHALTYENTTVEVSTNTGYWIAGEAATGNPNWMTYDLTPFKVSSLTESINNKISTIIGTNSLAEENISEPINDIIGDLPVTMNISEFKKMDATFDQKGAVTATVTLTCGAETETLSISIIIDKLIKPDKMKIEEAKPLAESAIAGITATNSTTEGNILDVVVTGISSVSGVNASWKQIPTITSATKEKTGSITGIIVLTCGTERAEVSVNKSIDKLPADIIKEVPKNDPGIKKATSPKTGDNTNSTMYAFLLLLSGFAAGTVIFRKK